MAGVLGVNSTTKFKATDISAYLTNAKMTRTVKTKPSGTFGVMDETFVEAQRDTKLAIQGLFDKSAGAPDVLLYNAPGAGAGAFEYYPESSAGSASNIKYSGSAILTKHEDDSKWDDLVKFSGDFQVTGALTRSIVP